MCMWSLSLHILGSSIIINIIKSVHIVLFFVTPPPLKIVLWKCWFFNDPVWKCNASIHNQHFKKRTLTINPLPPAYSVYSFENDDTSGRPLWGLSMCYVALFSGNVDTHPLPRNANKVEPFPCYLVPSSRLLVITMIIFLHAFWSFVEPHSSVSVRFVTALMLNLHNAFRLEIWHPPTPS